MSGTEVLYNHSSLFITASLFLAIMLFNEFGFRIGRYVQMRTDAEVKSMTGAIQASILGLLALLLGFTFSMSMQRFDGRSLALIDEANAIGTTMLRVQLLPESYRDNVNAMLQEYVQLRVGLGKVDLTQTEERKAYNLQIIGLQNRIWDQAVEAAHEDPRPVTAGTFITALNGMIDSQGKRNALLQMHVPEVVLLLLFAVFMVSGSMQGYSSGLGGRRVVVPSVMMSLLISLIVFIIIDLDRPKRGMIQVDQSSMVELLQTVTS